MIAALATAVLFAFSAAFSRRALNFLDYRSLLLVRLAAGVVATGLLSAATFQFDVNVFSIFIVSGIIGMGLGDLAALQAMKRLGSRLTVLLVQCGAAPMAAAAEWVLGTSISLQEAFAASLILAGVFTVLLPDHPERVVDFRGIALGLLGAGGQASGAVLSRAGYAFAENTSASTDGIQAALYRNAGGLVVAVAVFFWNRPRHIKQSAPAAQGRGAWKWIVGCSLAGPVFGLSLYQHALRITPGGIVLPVVALSPLLIVPISWTMEKDRPSLRSLAGGIVSVTGLVLLAFARAK